MCTSLTTRVRRQDTTASPVHHNCMWLVSPVHILHNTLTICMTIMHLVFLTSHDVISFTLLPHLLCVGYDSQHTCRKDEHRHFCSYWVVYNLHILSWGVLHRFTHTCPKTAGIHPWSSWSDVGGSSENVLCCLEGKWWHSQRNLNLSVISCFYFALLLWSVICFYFEWFVGASGPP